MNGFPGVGIRIQARLKALGYSKNGRPDILRFCQERAYRPQYLYAWLRGRLPAWENLVRLPPAPAPAPAGGAARAPPSVESPLPPPRGAAREPAVRSYEARCVPPAERAPAPPRLLMIVR